MGLSSVSADLSSPAPEVHATFEPRLFFYNINWRSRSYHAGATLTGHHGNGSDFAGFAPLLSCPDPKRIDIRADRAWRQLRVNGTNVITKVFALAPILGEFNHRPHGRQ